MPQSAYVFPLALPILSHVVYSPVPSLHVPSVNRQPVSSTGYILSAMLYHSFVRLVPEWTPFHVCVSPLYADDFHVLSPWLPRICCVYHPWVRVRVRVGVRVGARVRVRVGVRVRVRVNQG